MPEETHGRIPQTDELGRTPSAASLGTGSLNELDFGSLSVRWTVVSRAFRISDAVGTLPRCEYPGGWLWAMPRSGLTLLPRGPLRRCPASDSSAGSLGVARRPPGAGAAS